MEIDDNLVEVRSLLSFDTLCAKTDLIPSVAHRKQVSGTNK